MWRPLAGTPCPGVPRICPGNPDAYIENSEFDDLRAAGERFAEQLFEAGVRAQVVTAAGVPRGYLNAIGSPLTFAFLDRFAAQLKRA